MMRFGVLMCVLVAGASAAYSSSSGAGAGAGSGSWNGYGTYGSKYPYNSNTQYSGGYVGTNGGGSGVYSGTNGGGGYVGTSVGYNNGFPFAPFPALPPIPTPYDYSNFVNNFIGSNNGQGGVGSSYAYSTPDATAHAASNLAHNNDLYNQNLQHQQAIYNNINHGFAANGGGGYNGAYAPNFAAASGSFGPGGYHQTASIYPTNPRKPNIDTRFGGGNDGVAQVSYSQGSPGYQGVSTASFSSSSDVNGQKQNHREAITSVNNNGKVTTYRVHN